MQTVDELLEEAEQKAIEKQASEQNGRDPSPVRGGSLDPRRTGRDGRDKYRERSRTRRSRDAEDDDDVRDGSANGSVRSRRRSRSPRRSSRDRTHRGLDDTYDRRRDDDRYRPRRDDYRPRDRRDDRPLRDDRRTDRDVDRSRSGRGAYRGSQRSPPSRSGKPKTPEPTDDERDRRTVFVQQLAVRLRTKELQSFFEQVGPVVEAQIVKDRVSGRSKG